uniref:NADH-ubiquinone oxidoreductase chain 2 n=1 Tax=Orius sauteri TaxID=82747 RepID=A0A068F5S1_ORISA|nr:NADH dehydrogenase subunit 2 [Orius sauteri]AID61650.1 NADH dehydrogenase subunit 2 [Orius sauteri]
MKKSTKMMFFTMMIIGTMITMSSNSWMSMWMGLEVNMMSFIPLIYKMKNNKSAESSMIYFLTQSMSSMLMLFSISMNSMMENKMMILLTISLMIKMGAAPFQMWFTEMMNKMSWMNCLILMTWQKMAPMFICQMSQEKFLMSSALSTMVGAIGGLNQTSTRKIMAFSSINHMGWMMMCTTFNNNLWIMYLLIYSTLMMPLAWMFNEKMIMHSSQMMTNMKSMTEKMNITCMMMSMGGMPPMLGFLPKWMAINSMMESNMYMIMIMMIMMSIITLFYYMRITMSTMMIYEVQKKWMMINQNKNMYTSIMLTMNLLLMTMMMFF